MVRYINRGNLKLAVLALISATFTLWFWGYIDPSSDWWPFIAAGFILMKILEYATNKITIVVSGGASR